MNKRTNPLIRAAKKKELHAILEAYLADCTPSSDGSKKTVPRIPNLAGFCRSTGCGVRAFSQFADSYPELADYICAVLEDEALTLSPSPTLLTAYLKRRLGYADKSKAEESETETNCGLMRLIFEHDIEEDGE